MNKERLKGLVAGVLVGCMLCSGTAYAVSATKSIDVTYRDIKVYKDNVLSQLKDANGGTVEPFIYNGTTYLPVRAVAELAGMEVEWDGATSSVYLWDDVLPDGTYFMDVCPPYQTENSYNFYHYTCDTYYSSETEYFSMCGIKYSNGLTMAGSNDDGTRAYFNLNGKYKSITMSLGSVDGSSDPAGVAFFVDGKMVAEYVVQPDDYIREITVPLNYGLQLRIVTMSGEGYGRIGLGNITVQ